MGGVKNIQQKTFKRLRKEMQQTDYSGKEIQSSDGGNDTSDLDELEELLEREEKQIKKQSYTKNAVTTSKPK